MLNKAGELGRVIAQNSWTIGFVAAVAVLSAISIAVAFWAIAALT